MRSVAWLMSALLRFLDLHQKALEFRCIRVWIKDRRRKEIRQRPRVLAFVLDDSPVALMDGETDLVDLFAVDHHRLDAFGDHRLRDILTADAGDFYFFAAVQPPVV